MIEFCYNGSVIVAIGSKSFTIETIGTFSPWEEFQLNYFYYLGFLSLTFIFSQTSRGRGRPFLTPLFHFHLLHGPLDNHRVITAESSPLNRACDQIQTWNPYILSVNR